MNPSSASEVALIKISVHGKQTYYNSSYFPSVFVWSILPSNLYKYQKTSFGFTNISKSQKKLPPFFLTEFSYKIDAKVKIYFFHLKMY